VESGQPVIGQIHNVHRNGWNKTLPHASVYQWALHSHIVHHLCLIMDATSHPALFTASNQWQNHPHVKQSVTHINQAC